MPRNSPPRAPAPWSLRGETAQGSGMTLERVLQLATAGWLLVVILWWSLDTAPADPPPVHPLPEAPGAQRKATLINTLLPAIRENNTKLLLDRQRATVLHNQLERHLPLLPRDQRWLAWQGYYYRLPDIDKVDAEWTRLLLRRLDVVPADLALAQGAIESAWGSSRFAREGNNYFGHWCFEPGCGLVPKKRPAGAVHEVRVFDSPRASVARYMQNLNSHPAYTRLRRIREALRRDGKPLSGAALAAGLGGYSALGDTYVHRVRALIRQNELEQYRRDIR